MGDSVTGHNPKWDGLRKDQEGDLALPNAAVVRDITYEVDLSKKGDVLDNKFSYVYRLFNKYKWERVVARDQRTSRMEPTGATRTGPSGHIQREYRKTDVLRWGFVLFQKFELWRTDMSLDSYYNFVTGAKLGIPAGAYGVGRIGVAVAPGAATTVGTAMGKAALKVGQRVGMQAAMNGVATWAAAPVGAAATPAGVVVAAGLADAAAAFIFVTYIMAWAVPSSRLESSGWLPVGGDWDQFVFKPDDVQLRYEDKVDKRQAIWSEAQIY